jgi:hypothetical protein
MLKEMMFIDTVTLAIDPPLPCAVVTSGGTCNRPARVVHACRVSGPRPGHWLIMPVCEECAEAGTALHVKDGAR